MNLTWHLGVAVAVLSECRVPFQLSPDVVVDDDDDDDGKGRSGTPNGSL